MGQTLSTCCCCSKKDCKNCFRKYCCCCCKSGRYSIDNSETIIVKEDIVLSPLSASPAVNVGVDEFGKYINNTKF